MTDLQEIKEMLLTLEKKVSELNTKIDNIDKTSEKMSEHIDFVEYIYSSISMPLNFVKNKIERIMGNETTAPLPITYNQNLNNNIIK